MIIRSPENNEEWINYFHLRWLILRSPWQQPVGSEKDELEFEKNTIHAMALADSNLVVGVARLNVLPTNIAQIRFMAVADEQQGTGVGSKLIEYLEKKAKLMGVQSIQLQARENAVDFYKMNKYVVIEKTFLLYDQIQHYLMTKSI